MKPQQDRSKCTVCMPPKLYQNPKIQNFQLLYEITWPLDQWIWVSVIKKETSGNIGHQASCLHCTAFHHTNLRDWQSVHKIYQINIILISSSSSYSITENKIPPAVFIVYSYTNTQWYLTLHKLFSGLTGFLFASHAYRIIRRSSSPGLSSNPPRKKGYWLQET